MVGPREKPGRQLRRRLPSAGRPHTEKPRPVAGPVVDEINEEVASDEGMPETAPKVHIDPALDLAAI